MEPYGYLPPTSYADKATDIDAMDIADDEGYQLNASFDQRDPGKSTIGMLD